jgi:hypothetical protein
VNSNAVSEGSEEYRVVAYIGLLVSSKVHNSFDLIPLDFRSTEDSLKMVALLQASFFVGVVGWGMAHIDMASKENDLLAFEVT